MDSEFENFDFDEIVSTWDSSEPDPFGVDGFHDTYYNLFNVVIRQEKDMLGHLYNVRADLDSFNPVQHDLTNSKAHLYYQISQVFHILPQAFNDARYQQLKDNDDISIIDIMSDKEKARMYFDNLIHLVIKYNSGFLPIEKRSGNIELILDFHYNILEPIYVLEQKVKIIRDLKKNIFGNINNLTVRTVVNMCKHLYFFGGKVINKEMPKIVNYKMQENELREFKRSYAYFNKFIHNHHYLLRLPFAHINKVQEMIDAV